MSDITTALKHYADFKGRCTRKPFWVFLSTTQVLLLLLITPLLMSITEEVAYMITERPEFLDIIDEIVLTDDVSDAQLQQILTLLQGCQQELALLLLQDYSGRIALAAVAVLLGLFLFIPTLSITVRRLRDAGQSPWWVYLSLMMFIPLPGVAELGSMLGLVVFIMCCLPSTKPAPQGTPELPPVPEPEEVTTDRKSE